MDRRRNGWRAWLGPTGVDIKRANVARVYDYLLGGTHNFLADQALGRTIAATEHPRDRPGQPGVPRPGGALPRRGRDRQFLDIGSGIPTEGNVHEVAQQAVPGARVVYADIDPVAVAHSKALLAGNQNAEIIEADLREPEKILADAAARRLIDFGQPAGCCSSRCCTSSAMPTIPGGRGHVA